MQRQATAAQKNKRWERERENFVWKLTRTLYLTLLLWKKKICWKDTRSSIKKSLLVCFPYLMVFIRFFFRCNTNISNIFQDYTHIFALLLSSCYECSFVELSVSSHIHFLFLKHFFALKTIAIKFWHMLFA